MPTLWFTPRPSLRNYWLEYRLESVGLFALQKQKEPPGKAAPLSYSANTDGNGPSPLRKPMDLVNQHAIELFHSCRSYSEGRRAGIGRPRTRHRVRLQEHALGPVQLQTGANLL